VTSIVKENNGMTARKIFVSVAATLVLSLTAVVAPAQASLQIDSFVTTSSTNQAGAHPDLSTSFTLHEAGVAEAARNVAFNAPTGLFGNPNVLLECSSSDFAFTRCAPDSQAGLVTIYANYNGEPNKLLGTAPIYQLDRGANTALFAFLVPVLNIPIQIPVAVRTGSDFGLRFTVAELTQTAPLVSAELTFWGFPASATHNAQRFPKGAPGKPAGCPGVAGTACIVSPVSASIPDRPMIDNPTICTGEPLVTNLEVQTYQDPSHPTLEEGSYPAITGCEHMTFKPVLHAELTTDETDSASGLDLSLEVPQFLGVAPSPSQLRTARMTLPEGLTINPDAADGQTACPESDANFGTELKADCPDSSKIGTFLLGTPALKEPLVGAIYIGEPKPGDQYRLFLTADGSGLHAKLVGTVRPDAHTGTVTVELIDLPQAPFDNLQLHLFASDRGLLATPTHCTLYRVESRLFPWNYILPDVGATADVSLKSGPHAGFCPGEVRPFAPRLEAGTSNPVAGQFSNFHLKLDRDDGDQFLGDLNFRMPPGFTGDLRGISYCSETSITAAAQKLGRAEQADPSCPASSQIGTTNVAAGPGSHPFHAVGKMYLAGPFKGAPLSLVAITPALAGPYDYGVVLVRVALHVDPLTAQVTAASDTVPSIIGGIPIRMRSIQVNIDKPNFTINPTNCSPFTVDSQGIGDQGTVTDFSSYFSAVNCATLPFKPRMTVRQVGNHGTHRASNPTLQFDLNTRKGDANIKSLSVTLSTAFEIDQEHLGNICSEKELAATECAGRQQIGEATTTTPLLDQPLSGPVYAVSGSGGLPRLAFVLRGQVNLLPRADAKTVKGRLRTTVPVVPDAPIGHFHLVVFGGKQGYLANTRDICRHAPLIKVAYTAQNGATTSQSLKVKSPCGGSKARRKRHGN
jgi:hypothetical protein